MNLRVETYSGFKGDERPVAFYLGENRLTVAQIPDQWYDPQAIYFKVLASDGNLYILRHEQTPQEDLWSLKAYRRGER